MRTKFNSHEQAYALLKDGRRAWAVAKLMLIEASRAGGVMVMINDVDH